MKSPSQLYTHQGWSPHRSHVNWTSMRLHRACWRQSRRASSSSIVLGVLWSCPRRNGLSIYKFQYAYLPQKTHYFILTRELGYYLRTWHLTGISCSLSVQVDRHPRRCRRDFSRRKPIRIPLWRERFLLSLRHWRWPEWHRLQSSSFPSSVVVCGECGIRIFIVRLSGSDYFWEKFLPGWDILYWIRLARIEIDTKQKIHIPGKPCFINVQLLHKPSRRSHSNAFDK